MKIHTRRIHPRRGPATEIIREKYDSVGRKYYTISVVYNEENISAWDGKQSRVSKCVVNLMLQDVGWETF